MEKIPVWKCEAVKCYSGLWALTKVLNNEPEFRNFEVIDGDYLDDNLYPSDLAEIKEGWEHITFELTLVGDGDIDIHNIKEKSHGI